MNKTNRSFEKWWDETGIQTLYALNTTTDDDIKTLAGIAWEVANSHKLQKQVEVCNWIQDSSDAECNAWKSDCGEYWGIVEGTPTENQMKFCHGCGKPIKEHPFQYAL